ncbi:hypothetical protein [Actinomyces oricola]
MVSIVDFSMVAGSEQVQATSAPVLRSGDTSIMRMRAGDQELLSAVDVAGSSSYPLWTIPLPSGTDPCWVDSDIVHCGDGVAVDAGSGHPRGDAASAGAGAAPEPGFTSALLTETASAQVPYALSGSGSVVDAAGNAVEGLTLGSSVWGVPAQVSRSVAGIEVPGKRDIWVLCDGAVVAAVEGTGVLWSVDLAEGSAEINGFVDGGSPRWLVGDALVMGTPSGVVAWDLGDGRESWRIDVPLNSWTSDDQYLYLWSNDSLSVADLAQPVDDSVTEVTAVAQHREVAPGEDELMNATLEVPERCGLAVPPSEFSEQGRATITFVDGTASGGLQSNATTRIEDVSSTVFNGRPAAVVTALCDYGGAYGDDVVMVYNPDLELVAVLDPGWRKDSLGGRIDDFNITSLTAFGESFHLTWDTIGLYGDATTHAGYKSGSADGDFVWDGQDFVVTDVLFHTPQGDVRMPEVSAVQDFATAISIGDDATASQSATPEAMASLSDRMRTAAATPETVREFVFAPGVTVEECVFVPPIWSDSGTVYFPSGKKIEFTPPSETRGGDVICATTGSLYDTPRSDRYQTWILLRPHEDGTFEAYKFSTSSFTC